MDFVKKTLGDLTVGKGQYGIGASAVDYSEDLYTYLRITDINDDGTLNVNNLKSINDKNAERYLLQPNDIVFARTGNSTGRNYFYDGTDGILVYAGFLIKFSIDSSKVNPKYIKYYCMSDEYKGWVQGHLTGSTRGNINAQTYANMEISIPPREQQNRIVSILEELERKRKNNIAINRNLYEQAVALFEAMYQGYPVKKIGELDIFVTDYVANGSFASLKENVTILEEKNYAYFVRNVDLKAKEFPRFVNQHSYEFLSKSKLVGGEVIISNVGDVGSVFLCPKLDGPMTLGNNMIMLTSPKHNNYLYLFFKSYIGQGKIGGITGGSAQPKFNKTDFKSLEINYPDESQVDEFNEKTSALLDMISKLDEENKQLTALRDSLLPKLMSGELDVSDLDI
jgi:restriction endonuclease S subunit